MLTIPALEGDVLEDFSMRVAEKWRLGDSKRDDGLLVLVAAFLRRKWLVSLLCIPAVVAPAAVMSAALPFVSVAKKLEASRGYESLDPTLGVGMFILLLGAILALVGGGIVWAEPRVGRRSPPHVVPHAGG